MQKPDFWTNCGETMELTAEGNRLIAQEVATLVSGIWQRAVHSFGGLLHGLGQHQQLPPS